MADIVLSFARNLLIGAVDILMFAMMGRAILSWVDREESWAISGFLYCVTEPLILPFRRLCEEKHWFESTPLDVPFFMAVLSLSLLETAVAFL